MLFNKEHFGKPISPELSTYLRDWTDKNDYIKVNNDTGISISTLRDVVLRANSLTENNSKAIIALMKIAVINCNDKINYAKKVKKKFEDQLKAA